MLQTEKRKKETFSLEKKTFYFQIKTDYPFSNEEEGKNVDPTTKLPLSTSLTLGEHLPGLFMISHGCGDIDLLNEQIALHGDTPKA